VIREAISSRSPAASHAAASSGSSVVQVRMDLGGATLVVVAVLALVIGACGVVMGMNLSRQRELEDSFLKLDRQYRMVELKLDDWTVVAHRAGIVLPDDYARGPQGNPDSKAFNIPQRSMGAGGIIQQEAAVLIPAANSPVLYTKLPSNCKARVDAITAKGALACVEADVEALAAMILVAVHC
jgi:hypothetical protein